MLLFTATFECQTDGIEPLRTRLFTSFLDSLFAFEILVVIMYRSVVVLLVALMMALPKAEGFGSSAFCPSCRQASRRRSADPSCLRMAVVDIDSEAAFDKTIKSAGSALVIVDYSTTWCGPCKVIAPKFDQLSDKYPEAVFLKVRRSMRGNTRDLPSSRETDQCWWKYFLGDC